MAKRKTVRWVVTGDKAIDRKFKKLGPKLSTKIARKAARVVMKPMHKDAIQFAPKDTGELAKGIKLRAAKSKKRGAIMFEVRTEGPHGYLAVFNEYGGRHNPAKPFMRKSFEMNKDQARARLLQLIWEGIRKELKR